MPMQLAVYHSMCIKKWKTAEELQGWTTGMHLMCLAKTAQPHMYLAGPRTAMVWKG